MVTAHCSYPGGEAKRKKESSKVRKRGGGVGKEEYVSHYTFFDNESIDKKNL